MLLLLFTTIALASSPPLAPGAAARSLSFMTVGGAKLAIAHQMASNPHIDQACVQRMGGYALAHPFEAALEQQLTKAQLENANKYYTTPLAKRYIEFRLQQLSGEMGLTEVMSHCSGLADWACSAQEAAIPAQISTAAQRGSIDGLKAAVSVDCAVVHITSTFLQTRSSPSTRLLHWN